MSGLLQVGPTVTGPLGGVRVGPRIGPRGPFDAPAPLPGPRFPTPAPRPAPPRAPGPAAPPAPRPVTRPAPQAIPRPRTVPRTREAERDCTRNGDKDCVECPPEQGTMAVANAGKGHSMSDLSAQYQQWVTNFPFPYEWQWSGTWWDGFDEPRCTLLEAKANYAFMFIPLVGLPRPWANVESELILPAERHAMKARPTPPVSVEWHFLQRIVYEYCSEQYAERGLTNLRAFWNPMPGHSEHDDYQQHRDEEKRLMEEDMKNNPERWA